MRWFICFALGCAWSLSVKPLVAADDKPVELVPRSAAWKFFARQAEPGKRWQAADFDDAQWASGLAGFGYGDRDDRSVLANMRGQFGSVYIRHAFDVVRPSDFKSLILYVRYDDGFIAYLNGRRIAAASVREANGVVTADLHEARGYEPFEIKDASRLLQKGRNVLAIEGHNARLESSDFTLDPFLVDREIDALDELLDADDYRADLDDFERRLLDQSSYLTRRGFDYGSELKRIRSSINDATTTADFVRQLEQLVAQIGDCHAAVLATEFRLTNDFLPFRLADAQGGVIAMSSEQNQLLQEGHPYLESIDGVPIATWIEAASADVARGSAQFIRHRSLAQLARLGLLRHDLGLPESPTVVVQLRAANGDDRVQRTLRVGRQLYGLAEIRKGRPRLLEGNLGYLRLPVMDDRLIEPVIGRLKEFRETDGLIIDVRDNSGGTYGLLRALHGFFRPAAALPYVTNIAAYRLSSQFASDHIAYRPTYRQTWDGWRSDERQAIAAAAQAFRPEWAPPPDKFSEWHYMVLSRQRCGRQRTDDFFYYDKPVVVLSNAGSFSATDGFLSAFADLPNVTIVGEPSAGGSGATRRFLLDRTQVLIALSSMASFRANGKTFDGNGVEVDIRVMPAWQDFIDGTKQDAVLARAVNLLRGQN